LNDAELREKYGEPPFFDDKEMYQEDSMGETNPRSTVKISISTVSIIVLLVVQLIGVAFGYGLLTQQVTFNRELIKQYQITQQIISDKLDDFNGRLTRIETLLNNQDD
jgi:hypothetical protein